MTFHTNGMVIQTLFSETLNTQPGASNYYIYLESRAQIMPKLVWFGPEGPTLNELADPGPRRVIASVRVALQKVVVRIDRGQQNLV